MMYGKICVAGLISPQLFPSKLKDYNVIYSEGVQLRNVSLNDVTDAGIYYVSGYNVTDTPADLGVVIVVTANWQTLQLYISDKNKVYVRIYWSSWSSWSTLN